MSTLADAIAAIKAADRIAITTHIRPDGDAIGSTLGLRRILAAAGKSATIVGMDTVPARYAFLMHEDAVIPAAETAPAAYDLLIVLDTGAPDRAPAAIQEWFPNVRTLNIDHHPTNTGFADINHVNPIASSVGEMICELAECARFTITAEAAEALWVALITDTGRFAYSNTRPATLQAGAALLRAGVRTDRIDDRIYNSATAAQIRLQGRAIEHLELHEDGRCALVSLSREDFAELGCSGEDADEIVNIPRRVNGTGVAVFLYELKGDNPRETKASLRTNEPFDAARLCRDLGGGGHARAAGCTLPMPLSEAREHILAVIHNAWFRTP
jgi:phosphoesterase RecJ-like protein